jgi:archaellum biogenesis ATPase FlaH
MVNILALISSYLYPRKICQIALDVEKINDKILYVSLNKTYRTLLAQFKQDNISLNKFFFIDVITATVIDPKPDDNCLFLPAADDLNALHAGIIKTVKEKGVDMVVFDSLSSLTTYKNLDEIVHFVTTLLGSLSVLECSAIFTCLLTDEDAPLIQHIKMKVDKSYELS